MQMRDLFEGSLIRLQATTGGMEQRDQVPESRQRTTWVSTHRQLLATVLVRHPVRQDLTPSGGLDFDLLDSSTAMSADNRQFTPSMKGVQRVVDGHFGRIAGIILGRPMEFRSPPIVTSSD